MTKPLIEISGLFKVFGPKPLSVMDRVKKGEHKDAILADTGRAYSYPLQCQLSWLVSTKPS